MIKVMWPLSQSTSCFNIFTNYTCAICFHVLFKACSALSHFLMKDFCVNPSTSFSRVSQNKISKQMWWNTQDASSHLSNLYKCDIIFCVLYGIWYIYGSYVQAYIPSLYLYTFLERYDDFIIFFVSLHFHMNLEKLNCITFVKSGNSKYVALNNLICTDHISNLSD